jgi:hypothetical protein
VAPSVRQSVELFHLVFLRALAAKGEDKSLVALKGGCNLRFFFGSARYSEDIDFDVVVIARTTLKNKVERLLRSPHVVAPLRARGLEIIEISATKQTDTTQRWKAGLRVHGVDVPIRTKIEFSRRDAIDGATFERIEDDVLRSYALTPILTTHYTASAAATQKILALAGRTEPQARDVFDLDLLFARPDTVQINLSDAQKTKIPGAIERALGISFDDYRSHVVAYLDPEQAELYASRSAWDAIQETVVGRLETLR